MVTGDKNSKNKIILFISNLFWFSVIAFLSYKMPLWGDDFIHGKSFATGEVITSIEMAIESVKVSYQVFNGRLITMFLIHLMMLFPRPVFVVCNALVYIALANLLAKYINCGTTNSKNVAQLNMIFLFMWFLMPDFAEVTLWLSGCVTYMWMNLVVMGFGYLYYRDLFTDQEKVAPISFSKIIRLVIFGVFGVFAGWSAEASAAALLFGLFLYFVWAIRNKKIIALEKWVGALACLFGYVMLIFAPANRIRITNADSTAAQSNVISTYFFRIARETYYAFILLLIPIAISIAIYIISLKKTGERNDNFFAIILSEMGKGKEILFWIIGFISIYVMTFSAGFANRIFQFPFFMLIIAIGKSCYSIAIQIGNSEIVPRLKKAFGVFCVILMFLAVVESSVGVVAAKSHNSFFDRQVVYYYLFDYQGVLSDGEQ